MCLEGGNDASVSSEVSETTTESNESTTELYEENDTIESGESTENLMEETDTSVESELVEKEFDDSNSENFQEKETIDDSDTCESEVDAEAVRVEINEKSNYSNEVNEKISSVEELEVYQEANLREENVDGRVCLVRDDIDWDQKDEFGRTNQQRIEEDELVPYNTNGEKIELHHIGQKDDSPFAELTQKEHRGKGRDTILHNKQKETEIDRPEYNKIRIAYWKSRINNVEENK